MSTQSTTTTATTATAPTGDIKVFIDAFNKDFDLKLKSLLDSQQNYKNVYTDAIKITTPKEGPWPKDPKVVTIGDLFKYTFPDIESDKVVEPPRPTINDYEDYNGWTKDLKNSKDEKIKTMYNTINSGIRSNKDIQNYQDLKKPGITNPSLWSPGQYYFDVFMSVMLSSYGPLKDPTQDNGGSDGSFGDFAKTHGGSVSVSFFDASGEVELSKRDDPANPKLDYYEFYEVLDSGYLYTGTKYKMSDITGVNISLGDQSPRTPISFTSLKTQYRSGLLSDLIQDPKFNRERGGIEDAAGKYVDSQKTYGGEDITGFKFTGNYEHILLYKAFIQAGDNYKSVVLPVRNPEEPKPEPQPATVLSKPLESTAVGEVQFKFNVEKIDTFIVVGGTVSPPLELTIVPNDGTQYILEDTPDDVFEPIEGLDDEYTEEEYGSTEEERLALQALFAFGDMNSYDAPEYVKSKANKYKETVDNNNNNNSNDNVTTAQLKNASSEQDFWTLVAICSREDGDPQAWCDVAQSIYNRVGSGSYNAKNITTAVTATWQYEPCWSFPRKSGTNGQVNSEWKKCVDINSASVASGQPISRLKEVVAALKNKTLQQNSKNLIGGRTDFLGVGQPASAMTNNGSKVQRTPRNNQFGYSFNYKKTVCYNIPNIVDTISVA
jgi:hypothetical protein